MTEVVEDKELEEKPEEKPEEKSDETTASEIESLAIKMGWNPDHKDGDREYKTAEEYILNGREIQNTMARQAKSTKREMEGLRRGIELQKTHNETVYNAQVAVLKGRVAELESKRAEAIEDGDNKAVAVIDNQIKDINQIPDKLPAGEAVVDPVFAEWVEDEENDWYKNEDMKAYADYQADNNGSIRGLPTKKFLKKITEMVKEQFPEEFPGEVVVSKTKKTPSVSVEAATRRGGKTKTTAKWDDLSRGQQDIAIDLEKAGVMTREEYIKDLEKIAEARQ